MSTLPVAPNYAQDVCVAVPATLGLNLMFDKPIFSVARNLRYLVTGLIIGSVGAATKPSFDMLQLVVRLPLLAVTPAHQPDLLGLDYNGLDTGHTHASTVQSDITECNQRRLVDSCNNRAIEKLH